MLQEIIWFDLFQDFIYDPVHMSQQRATSPQLLFHFDCPQKSLDTLKRLSDILRAFKSFELKKLKVVIACPGIWAFNASEGDSVKQQI